MFTIKLVLPIRCSILINNVHIKIDLHQFDTDRHYCVQIEYNTGEHHQLI